MNKEKLMGWWQKIKTTLGKVSKKIWILIAAILVVAVAAVVIFYSTRPYATLITGATSEESATVVDWLNGQGVTDYRMDGTGTILVPENQVISLKSRLIQEQFSTANSPWSGYFERVSALSTVKDRDNAWLVTLMEDMESVIRSFPGVHDADVKINLGEDNSYVLDTNKVVNASVGVMLTMENGKVLEEGQANSIRNYISKSIANLSVDDISIQDTRGNIYDGLGASGATAADASALKIQMERYWGNLIANQIEQVLVPTFGRDHVAVTARANVELGDKTVNKYEVELPEFAQDGSTGGRGIVGSKSYAYTVVSDGEVTAGGIVGTSSNSDLPTYVEEGEDVMNALGRIRGEGNTEYDNSKTQTYMTIQAATLTDISVAVSLDSTVTGPLDIADIRQFVAAAANIVAPYDMEELTVEEYQARKAEYLTQRVGVLVWPWYHEPEAPTPPTFLETLQSLGIPMWVLLAAAGGLLLFIIILVTVIALVRRGRKKKQEQEQRAVDELLSTAMQGQPGEVVIGEDGQPIVVPSQVDQNGDPVSGADVMDLHTERSMELRQNIRDYVDENMEVAALLIKSWLKEDESNG